MPTDHFTHAYIELFYLSLAFIVALIGVWHNASELKATEQAIALENRRALLSKAYGTHVSISDPRVHRNTTQKELTL
jgi:hypothetical protein